MLNCPFTRLCLGVVVRVVVEGCVCLNLRGKKVLGSGCASPWWINPQSLSQEKRKPFRMGLGRNQEGTGHLPKWPAISKTKKAPEKYLPPHHHNVWISRNTLPFSFIPASHSYKPFMIEIVALDFPIQLLQKIRLWKLKIFLALLIAYVFSAECRKIHFYILSYPQKKPVYFQEERCLQSVSPKLGYILHFMPLIHRYQLEFFRGQANALGPQGT